MALSTDDGPITDDLVETFDRDGVVCLRGVFTEWVDPLRAGVADNLAAPSPHARCWDRDGDGRRTRFDCRSWESIPQYRAFVEESPMAEFAGRLMASEAVNFFYDAIFVRDTGVQFRTPFHQDEPYWSIDGFQTCSAWMPLVPVERRSTLEFVRGSHRWPQRFAQTDFGGLTGDERDHVTHRAGDDGRVPFPDIEGERDRHDIIGWAMEPGDVAVFNARIIHGGSGNLAPDRDLRVFNTQWAGDDARVVFRPEGMDPDHRDVMQAEGLAPGDRLRGPRYPQLWRA